MTLTIRELETTTDLTSCVSIQEVVWGPDDELVDAGGLSRALDDGGILLGGFGQGNQLVGFVFSFRIRGLELEAQHSHMLAVLPEFRDSGIGLQLKEAQFRVARKRGTQWVVWTFDPLESRNSHLNLNKLGARASTYFVDFYPGSRSLLHAGLETDRLVAERDLQVGANRSSTIPAGETPPHKAVESVRSDRGFPIPGPPRLENSSEVVLIEIPCDIQNLKQSNSTLAKEWREATREAFRYYLDRRYVVEGFLRRNETRPSRAFHLLRYAPLVERLGPRLDFSRRPFQAAPHA